MGMVAVGCGDDDLGRRGCANRCRDSRSRRCDSRKGYPWNGRGDHLRTAPQWESTTGRLSGSTLVEGTAEPNVRLEPPGLVRRCRRYQRGRVGGRARGCARVGPVPFADLCRTCTVHRRPGSPELPRVRPGTVSTPTPHPPPHPVWTCHPPGRRGARRGPHFYNTVMGDWKAHRGGDFVGGVRGHTRTCAPVVRYLQADL
jgi:hypothetical protein